MTLLRRTRPATTFAAGLFAEDHTPTVRESFFATTPDEGRWEKCSTTFSAPGQVDAHHAAVLFLYSHAGPAWPLQSWNTETSEFRSMGRRFRVIDRGIGQAGQTWSIEEFVTDELASMPPISGGSGDLATAEPGMAADSYDEIADQFHSGDDEFDPSPLNWSLVSPSVLPPARRAAWDVAFRAGEYCEVRQKISTPPAGFDAMEREAFRRGMARERARGEAVEFAAEAIRAFEDFGVVDPRAKSCPSCFEVLGASDGPLCWSCRADRDEAEATKLRRGPSAVDLAWAAGYEAAKASESPVRAPSHYTPGEAEAFDAGCDAYGAEWAEEMALRAEADLEMSLSPEDRAEAGLMPAKGVCLG